jgi:hypothetical protein
MNIPRRIEHLRERTQSIGQAEILRATALFLSALLVVMVLVIALGRGTPASTSAGAATPQPKSAQQKASQHPARVATPKPLSSPVPLGVYAGAGSPAAATVFQTDVGTTVPYALDYLDDSSWTTISDPAWFLQRWAGSGFQMIFGVPMLPKTGGSLAAGARGDYNALYATLAQVLIDNGQASAVLMPGWDPEDTTLPWSATTMAQAEDYVAEFNQIVATMRAVPGARFQFVWDASNSPDAVAPSALYPGDAVVNVIATDAFDLGIGPVNQRFTDIARVPYGLNWFARFATHHDKPLMIAKWGVAPTANLGAGDDPGFVSDLLSWSAENHVFAAVTWDDGTWAITGGAFPHSASILRQLVTASVQSPLSKVVESSATPASAP